MFKYQEIIRNLETEVFPKLSPGSLLPAERELCVRYAVSDITVKKALSMLAHERRVKRVPGKGTIYSPEHRMQVSVVSMRPPRTVLKVLTLSGWDSADLLEKICQEFTARNPEIEFEFYRASSAYFAESSPADYDLIHGNTWMIREYLTSPDRDRLLLPLEELPGFYIDEPMYFPECLDWCRVEDELYCLPLGISPVIAMFNMDYPVFKRLPLPDCETFSEFVNLLYRLRYQRPGEGNYYPFLLETSENRWPCFIKMQGGRLFDAVTRRCLFDSEPTVAAFRMVQQLIKDKVVPGLQLGWDLSINELFLTGNIGCMFGTFKHLRSNVTSGRRVQYRMLPQSNTRCSHLLIEGILVNRRVQHPEVIGRLFNYFQTSAAQLAICRQADTFSAQKELARLYLESLAAREPSAVNLFQQVQYAEPVIPMPRNTGLKTINGMLSKIWMGLDSVENVCQEITETINGKLA